MEERASVGAIIGCSVCILLAWGNPPLVVLLSAFTGISCGSIVGVLLWITSIKLPSERIIAPSPGEVRRPRRRVAHPTRPVLADGRRRPCPGYQPFAAPRELRVADRRSASGCKVSVRNWYGWLMQWWRLDGETGCRSQHSRRFHHSHLWRLPRVGFGAGDVRHGVKPALRQRSFSARRKHVYR